MQGLALDIAGGALTLDGSYAPDKAALEAGLKDLSLAVLERLEAPALKGSVDLALALSGTPAAPRVQWPLTARDAVLVPEDKNAPALPPLGGTLEATLQEGALRAELQLRHKQEQLLQVAAQTRTRFALEPFAFELDQQGPLGGSIKGGADLVLFQDFLALSDQTLDGKLGLDLQLAGTMERPEVPGEVRLDKGR